MIDINTIKEDKQGMFVLYGELFNDYLCGKYSLEYVTNVAKFLSFEYYDKCLEAIRHNDTEKLGSLIDHMAENIDWSNAQVSKELCGYIYDIMDDSVIVSNSMYYLQFFKKVITLDLVKYSEYANRSITLQKAIFNIFKESELNLG